MTAPTIGAAVIALAADDLSLQLDSYGRAPVYMDGGAQAPGVLARYSFIVGDSTPVIGPQVSRNASHAYTEPGVYTLTINVVFVDEDGEVTSDDPETTSYVVTVTYADPVEDPTAPEGMPQPRHPYVPLDPDYPMMIVRRLPRS